MQEEQKFPYFLAFFPLANAPAEELLQEEEFAGTARCQGPQHNLGIALHPNPSCSFCLQLDQGLASSADSMC